MKFYDKTQILCISWAGGNGAVSARREAWVPYGWPSGWNWWHGGSVIFQADENYNTLIHLRFQKEWIAKEGFPGESADKYGKSSEDLIIPVPIGSLIKILPMTQEIAHDDKGQDKYNFKSGAYTDDDEEIMNYDSWIANEDRSDELEGDGTIVYHFTEHGEQFVICKWGIGWAGNMHFKNSLVQYPDFALMGEPGQKRMVEIELQLLADVWLIGMPSVGKSSIINSISNSKAKVAEYHFTTLVPNLWSVQYHDTSRNVIDIPGLVDGASTGKWLGNEFLRHVLKARIFMFVLDITRYDEGILEFGILRKEIVHYMKQRFVGSQEFGYEIEDIHLGLEIIDNQIIVYLTDQNQQILLKKGIARVINKIDEVMDEETIQEYKSELLKHTLSTFATQFPLKKLKLSEKDLGKAIQQQIIEYSTILDYLKPKLLESMVKSLQSVPVYHIHYDPMIIKNKRIEQSIELVGECGDEEVQELLRDLGYNDISYEDDEEEVQEYMSQRKLRRISDPDVTRLGYQLQWWKVLAEEWFFRVLKQQGVHKRLNRNGVKNGDLLRVIGDYNSSRHIVFRYALGKDTKTSYTHQKLT